MLDVNVLPIRSEDDGECRYRYFIIAINCSKLCLICRSGVPCNVGDRAEG
jgi:hypothetical protein